MGFKLFLLLEKILLLLPQSFRQAIFSFAGTISYYFSSKYRDVSFANLDFIYGDKMSKDEKVAITKHSFKNLLYNFMHLMEVQNMSLDDFKKRVKMKNIEAAQKAHDEGRAVIYITAHYCSWEFANLSISAYIEPMSGVFKEMKNQDYQKWVLNSRSKFGNTSREKSNVLKPLIRDIKNKKAVGIVIDTSLNKREGVEVEFMGKLVNQTSTPAYLARKYNAAIIPGIIHTDDDVNYTVTLYDEIKVDKTENEKEDIQKCTQLQADWLSNIINQEPKCWFWIHRRFKREYPEIYKKRKRKKKKKSKT
jgi:KDO2-lipid IV(A) lauroyltransferase